MKKVSLPSAAMLFTILILWACTCGNVTRAGEEAFIRNCSNCHADGGNSIMPDRTLWRKHLEANGITTQADIIEKIRKPGPAMPAFDRVQIPDETAEAIAAYILKTFK